MRCTHCIAFSVRSAFIALSGVAPELSHVVFDPHVSLVQPTDLLEAEVHVPDAIVDGLQECGFDASVPDGAYYVMAGISSFGATDDVAFARRLIEEAAVATVPASSFYHDPVLGRGHVRFSFPKKLETIERGLAALRAIPRP